MHHTAPITLFSRPMPKQERAQRRAVEIVVAAAQVLAQQPHPRALSANLVADQAGVPVSSIYRYFPTMRHLLDELYLQLAEQIRSQLVALVDRPGPWRERLLGVADMLMGYLHDHPYYRPLMTLIAIDRGPTRVEHDFNAEIVAFLAARWAAGADGFHGGDAQAVAATTVQLTLALEELVASQPTPEIAAAHAQEMKRALNCYLSGYLHDMP